MACVHQTTKKYLVRPGPPYPAQMCPGEKRLGNDGLLYESIPNVKGVHRWVKVKDMSLGDSIKQKILAAKKKVAGKKASKKAVKKASKKAVKKAVKKASKKAVKKASKKAVKKASKKAVKKASKKAVKKAVKKASKKAVKKASKKAVKKASKKAVKKASKKMTKAVLKKALLKKTRKDILGELTITKLHKIAKEHGIKVPSKLKKAGVISKLLRLPKATIVKEYLAHH